VCKPLTRQTFQMTFRLITYFVLLSLTIVSCKDNNHKDTKITQDFLDSLVDKQVGQLSYYISLPTKYDIKEQEGPDFSVFYITNSDTTVKSSFSGGMYFGNYANEFPPKSDSCKVTSTDSQILGQNSTWTIYECDGEFTLQTIVDSKSGEGWNNQIHAFGHGDTQEDLDKILAIYSTLRKKD